MEDPFEFLEDRYETTDRDAMLAHALVEILRAMDYRRAQMGEQVPPVARRERKPDGSWGWKVPDNAPAAQCKYCDQRIYWVRSSVKKSLIPINANGSVHFESCKRRRD